MKKQRLPEEIPSHKYPCEPPPKELIAGGEPLEAESAGLSALWTVLGILGLLLVVEIFFVRRHEARIVALDASLDSVPIQTSGVRPSLPRGEAGRPRPIPYDKLVIFQADLVERVATGKEQWLRDFFQSQGIATQQAAELRGLLVDYMYGCNLIGLTKTKANLSDQGMRILLDGKRQDLQAELSGIMGVAVSRDFLAAMNQAWHVEEWVATSMATTGRYSGQMSFPVTSARGNPGEEDATSVVPPPAGP